MVIRTLELRRENLSSLYLRQIRDVAGFSPDLKVSDSGDIYLVDHFPVF